MAGLLDPYRRSLVAAMPITPCAPEFEPPKVEARRIFDTSFEASRHGSPAPTRIGPRGGKIFVTDKVAHKGTKSLAYVDAPEGVSFFPHSVQGMKRMGLMLKYRFSILYEEKTNFSFEMRDYGGKPLNGQFSTGPQITVKDGMMSAPGFVSKIAAPGKWITCDIEHSLGPEDVPGKSVWRVSFSDDTGASEMSGTIKAAPDYRQPTWAGMMSWATCDTCFYLDDIRYEWLGKQ